LKHLELYGLLASAIPSLQTVQGLLNITALKKNKKQTKKKTFSFSLRTVYYVRK